MSTLNAITNLSTPMMASDTNAFTGLSPDALLEYCQSQLSGLDGEISSSIKQQNLELREREAAEQAQGVIEQFGDAGPQNGTEMQSCVDALNKAISSLPAGDPVAAQLTTFRDDMCKKYGFTPATTLTTPADVQGGVDPSAAGSTAPAGRSYDAPDGSLQGGGAWNSEGIPNQASGASAGPSTSPAPAKNEVALQDPTNKPQNNDWHGTCDAIGAIVGDIKSNAEIQMLQLQDLVSQRQQAVSLATGMMSKEDQSLEQLARLGQG